MRIRLERRERDEPCSEVLEFELLTTLEGVTRARLAKVKVIMLAVWGARSVGCLGPDPNSGYLGLRGLFGARPKQQLLEGVMLGLIWRYAGATWGPCGGAGYNVGCLGPDSNSGCLRAEWRHAGADWADWPS